ncbi:MAG: hypothetical protein JWM32_1011 [Verrucomicrobia bacterium]|nr:hypothetical protein [Verrucomicrobiota bacterium]
MTTPSSNPPTPGAHAPKVALLPDAMFFVRAVPIPPTVNAAEAALQAELALEAVSPFPPAQLYHGFFRPPASTSALVFAAYRRRFPREQADAWGDAELVMPAFAALLGGKFEPATTILVNLPEGITAIHWAQDAVPSAVSFHPLAAEANEADRAKARDELLRGVAGSRRVIELTEPPAIEAATGEDEFVFRSGEHVFRLSAAEASTLDVRDKEELVAYRRSRARDVLLWRTFIGCAAAIVAIAVGWAGLYGAGFWQKTRQLKVSAQQPVVDQIMTAQTLTTRINELSTKRLLPLEMISEANGGKPASIQFIKATTDGLYTLRVDAQTTSPGEVSTYRSAIADLPSVERVEVRDQRTRDNVMSFMLVITFRPDALKPAASS